MCACVCAAACSPASWAGEGHVLVLVDEERVVLVVMDDIGNGWECEVADHVLALTRGVYVEVLTTVFGERVSCVCAYMKEGYIHIG